MEGALSTTSFNQPSRGVHDKVHLPTQMGIPHISIFVCTSPAACTICLHKHRKQQVGKYIEKATRKVRRLHLHFTSYKGRKTFTTTESSYGQTSTCSAKSKWRTSDQMCRWKVQRFINPLASCYYNELAKSARIIAAFWHLSIKIEQVQVKALTWLPDGTFLTHMFSF